MNHFDPDRVLGDGRREAASHDYPLIGLYDSADDCVLECHVLLMKLAGLHGVIIDWYGTSGLNDYAMLHRNTEKLIPWLRKAGLRFAICYEDSTLKKLDAAAAVKQGTADLQWVEKHWFGDEAYVNYKHRPVLLVFGPQYLDRKAWSEMRKMWRSMPLLFGLPHLAKNHGLDGIFAWPPVRGGKTLSPAEWRGELEPLYTGGEPFIAGAFPGFHDIYKQAGVRDDSYGTIEHRDGATFAETLDLALRSKSPLIQVATWNDYGEGTVIEPTSNHGYRYLELLQRRVKPQGYGVADLRLPVMLYQLRKRGTSDAELAAALDQAAALLFASKCAEAAAVLAKVSTTLDQQVR
ncbi:hypothetical protein ACFQ5Q_13240 [Luteolibacter ambystomatis]